MFQIQKMFLFDSDRGLIEKNHLFVQQLIKVAVTADCLDYGQHPFKYTPTLISNTIKQSKNDDLIFILE
jgi:hypothetical protein